MTTSQHGFLFNRAGALIAALPAVLGFVPEKSLVLATLEGGRLGAVMRVDLSSELAETVERLGQVTSTVKPDAAIAVIIDGECALCPLCAEDFRKLCERLSAVLARRGVALLASYVVDRVAAGGAWRCADSCGARGSVDDPYASPLAMAAVLDGRRLYARRGELQQVIAAEDPARGERIAAEVRRRLAQRHAGADEDSGVRRASDAENVIAVAARVQGGSQLAEAEMAEMACVLGDLVVRDMLYALAVGDLAGAAESLWATLSRALPEPWRVEALVLLAFSAYCRGDGPLAGVALDAALRCGGKHRMASMLDTALHSGMRPERIRELASTGYRLADRLGVGLPPQRVFPRRAC